MACSRYSQHGGSKLFEFVWVVLLVGVLSMVVLDYMLRYIEVAEKSAMENTVVNLQSALRLRLMEALLHNDVEEVVRLANENPINWLQEVPRNYAGEFDDPEPGVVAEGKWYYDLKSKELVYLVDSGREFTPGPDGRKWVRWRIRAPLLSQGIKEKHELTVNKAVGDISLVLSERYEWKFK